MTNEDMRKAYEETMRKAAKDAMTTEEIGAANAASSLEEQIKNGIDRSLVTGDAEHADLEKVNAFESTLKTLEFTQGGMQRDRREAEIEAFTTARAETEAKKGRNVTVVVMELDHSDGHVSNVVHGDLMHASKMCKHLSQDLAMRVIRQIANDMGFPIDGEAKA